MSQLSAPSPRLSCACLDGARGAVQASAGLVGRIPLRVPRRGCKDLRLFGSGKGQLPWGSCSGREDGRRFDSLEMRLGRRLADGSDESSPIKTVDKLDFPVMNAQVADIQIELEDGVSGSKFELHPEGTRVQCE